MRFLSLSFFAFVAAIASVSLLCSSSRAVPLAIANPSFESPSLPDGGFNAATAIGAQGTYGWTFGDGAGVYNPPAQDYTGAGGSGAPAGGAGAQVGWVFGFGDYAILQRLAGADSMLGNADDPLMEPFTIYTLKLDVGQRAAGNQFGGTNGGYDVQLRVGAVVGASTIVARETDAVPLPAGSLTERTIAWDSALATSSELFGLPLMVLLRKTIVSATADTDYDNVRLDAVFVPPSANFNEIGTVDAADLSLWKAGFGLASGATHMDGDADRNFQVNGNDFLLWQRQLGASVSAVPEPSVGVLALGLAAMSLAVNRSGAVGSRQFGGRSLSDYE